MPSFRKQFLILCFLAGTALQAAPELPEDCFPQLREIIEEARRNSPALRQSQEDQNESRANIDSVRGQQLPRVTGSLRMQTAYTKRIGSEYDSTEIKTAPSASFYASVPIFHWGEYEAKMDQAKARNNSRANYGMEKMQDVIQNLRRYFVEYQLAMVSADLAQEGLDYAKRRKEGLDSLLDSGMGSREDSLEAEIYYEERLDDLASSRNSAGYYQDLLKENSGESTLEVRQAELPHVEFLSQEALDALLEQAGNADLPLFQALNEELAASRAQFDEIRVRNRPKLDAVTYFNLDQEDEYRSSSQSYKTLPRVYAWGGIQANWTMYDGGTITADKLAARARTRKIEARIDEARMRQSREISSIARDAELNASRYDTKKRKLELLQASVNLMEQQSGSVSEDTLLQRRLDLQRTKLDMARAAAYYMLDIAQLQDLATYGSKQ